MVEYRVLPWAEALAMHGAEWLAIGRERRLNPSLLPDWTRIIVETLTDPGQVRVLVGTDGAKLVSLLPFQIRRGPISRIRVRILEPISSVMSYHAELVTRGEPEDLLRGLIQTRRQFPWDIVRLVGILLDSPSARAIANVAQAERLALRECSGDRSPYLHLETTAKSLLAARIKRDRYSIRKYAKDFAALPGAVERWYRPTDDMEALLGAILHIEAGSWKQAAGVAISSNPSETQYVRRLLQWLAANDSLYANVCFIDGEPVAYNLAYRWNGSLGCMKSTYTERFSHLSLGHFVRNQQIFRFADEGGQEFDFLGDAEPYKLDWSPTTRRHGSFFLSAPRGRGWWLGRAQRLRNGFRRAGWRTASSLENGHRGSSSSGASGRFFCTLRSGLPVAAASIIGRYFGSPVAARASSSQFATSISCFAAGAVFAAASARDSSRARMPVSRILPW